MGDVGDGSLAALVPLTAGRFEVAFVAPRTVALRGELAVRDPVAEFGPHFRAVHEAAAGGGEVVVDVTGLAFVNSSGLRVFLDWVAWIAAEPAPRQYRLRFRTKKGVTWQAASFPVLAMMGGAHVALDPV